MAQPTAGRPGRDIELARDHSLLLEERLCKGGARGPLDFAGLFGGHATRVNEYAFLAADEDAEPGQRPLQRWVSSIERTVPAGVQVQPRTLNVVMPPPAPRGMPQQQYAPVQQQQQPGRQPPAKHPRLSGRFSAGEGAAAAAPVAHAAPVPGNPLKIRLKIVNSAARAASREGSAEKQTPPCAGVTAAAASQLLQSVRQLGAGSDPLLSPIPAGWADVVSSDSPAVAEAQAAAQGGRTASPFEVSAGAREPRAGSAEPPLLWPAACAAPQQGAQQQVQQQQEARQRAAAKPHTVQQEQRRQTSPPAPAGAGAGSKRAAVAPLAGEAAPTAAADVAPAHKRLKVVGAVASSEAASPTQYTPSVPEAGLQHCNCSSGSGSHPLARTQSTNAGLPAVVAAAAAAAAQPQPAAASPAAKQGQQQSAAPAPAASAREPPVAAAVQQQQQPAVPGWAAEALASGSDETRLGAVAALLPAALPPAAGGELPSSRMVQALQEEGKKLKKFSEKKMRDGRPTHVSSMFLCQSCVKFLTVAATMEASPAKFSRESTSSMYSQTASLLDSCAHNAGRAEGPAMITTAISLLAQRLAAVARLRAAFCLRTEALQQVAAFRGALEKGSGETYQRPSPTDSNTSTSMSVPLDPTAPSPPAVAGLRQQQQQQAVAAGRSGTPTGGRGRAAAAVGGGRAAAPARAPSAPAPALAPEALVGMPKPVLERQLLAAQHSQALLGALSSLHRSSEKLREFMGQAAAQNSVHGLKVAAATLLLSADAGMGPASTVLSFAKDALDAVMQMQ